MAWGTVTKADVEAAWKKLHAVQQSHEYTEEQKEAAREEYRDILLQRSEETYNERYLARLAAERPAREAERSTSAVGEAAANALSHLRL